MNNNVFHAVSVTAKVLMMGVEENLAPGQAVRISSGDSLSKAYAFWRRAKLCESVKVSMLTCPYTTGDRLTRAGLVTLWEGDSIETAVVSTTHPVVLNPGEMAHTQFEDEEEAALWSGAIGTARAKMQSLFPMSGCWEYRLTAPIKTWAEAPMKVSSISVYDMWIGFNGREVKHCTPSMPFMAVPDSDGELTKLHGGGSIRLKKLEGSEMSPFKDFKTAQTMADWNPAEVYLKMPEDGNSVWLVDCLTPPHREPAKWTIAVLD